MVVKSKHSQILKRNRKVLEKLRQLAAEDPSFRGDLATAYGKTWAILFQMGKLDEALEMGRQALGLFRELAEEDPDTYLAEQAACCDNVGSTLAAAERFEEALELLHEGVRINQELGDQDPKQFLPILAGTHITLAMIYRDLEDTPQAREWAGNALYLSSLVAAQAPQKHFDTLKTALDVAADVMEHLDQGQRREWLDGVWNKVLETIRWMATPVAGPLGDFFLQAGLPELALEPFLLARKVLTDVEAGGADRFDGRIAEIAATLGPERTAALLAELEAKFAPIVESLPE